MRNFSTEGIILKRTHRGEHDHCITLFSPALGKIEAYARGARKITSSFSGHLEPLNVCDFSLYRNAGRYTITQCRSTETFKALRSSLKKTLSASVAGEIFEKTSCAGEQNSGLFNLIRSALTSMCKSGKTELVLESYKIKLMHILGILPDIHRCASCGKKAGVADIFTLNGEGQILCSLCRETEHGLITLPFGIIKLVNYLRLCDFDAIEKIRIRKNEHALLKKTTDALLQNYLGGEMASEGMLRRMC